MINEVSEVRKQANEILERCMSLWDLFHELRAFHPHNKRVSLHDLDVVQEWVLGEAVGNDCYLRVIRAFRRIVETLKHCESEAANTGVLPITRLKWKMIVMTKEPLMELMSYLTAVDFNIIVRRYWTPLDPLSIPSAAWNLSLEEVIEAKKRSCKNDHIRYAHIYSWKNDLALMGFNLRTCQFNDPDNVEFLWAQLFDPALDNTWRIFTPSDAYLYRSHHCVICVLMTEVQFTTPALLRNDDFYILDDSIAEAVGVRCVPFHAVLAIHTVSKKRAIPMYGRHISADNEFVDVQDLKKTERKSESSVDTTTKAISAPVVKRPPLGSMPDIVNKSKAKDPIRTVEATKKTFRAPVVKRPPLGPIPDIMKKAREKDLIGTYEGHDGKIRTVVCNKGASIVYAAPGMKGTRQCSRSSFVSWMSHAVEDKNKAPATQPSTMNRKALDHNQ